MSLTQYFKARLLITGCAATMAGALIICVMIDQPLWIGVAAGSVISFPFALMAVRLWPETTASQVPTPHIENVINEIATAFANVGLDEGVSLRKADVIDDYGDDEERAAAREHDELRDRQRRLPNYVPPA